MSLRTCGGDWKCGEGRVRTMSAVQSAGAVVADTPPGDAKPVPQAPRREDPSSSAIVDHPSGHGGDGENTGVCVKSNEPPVPEATPPAP